MTHPSENGGGFNFQLWTSDWDRGLNVYTIGELPSIPSDTASGGDAVPVSIRIMREFFLGAASAYAPEIWFEFGSPHVDGANRNEKVVNACYSAHGRGTTALKIPCELFFRDDMELGIFGVLRNRFSNDGMFAIHVSEFRDKPKYDPFDSRGRVRQPVLPPDHPDHPDHSRSELPEIKNLRKDIVQETDDTDSFPGVREVVTIRAFRVSLKGNSIPDDLVVQICPRFWHMPTGFEVG